MKKIIPSMLIILVALVQAETFDERVVQANAIENTAAYKRYERPMFNAVNGELATRMRTCMARFESPDTQPFIVVFNIQADGHPSDIEAQPETNLATCFASGLASIRFPPPPKLDGLDYFPLIFEMSIQ